MGGLLTGIFLPLGVLFCMSQLFNLSLYQHVVSTIAVFVCSKTDDFRFLNTFDYLQLFSNKSLSGRFLCDISNILHHERFFFQENLNFLRGNYYKQALIRHYITIQLKLQEHGEFLIVILVDSIS